MYRSLPRKGATSRAAVLKRRAVRDRVIVERDLHNCDHRDRRPHLSCALTTVNGPPRVQPHVFAVLYALAMKRHRRQIQRQILGACAGSNKY